MMRKRRFLSMAVAAAMLGVTMLTCTAFADSTGGPGAWIASGGTSSEEGSGTDQADSSGAGVTETASDGSTTAVTGSDGVSDVISDADGAVGFTESDAATDAARAALLQQSQTAAKTDQIILVVDHDLSLWNKQADGSWAKAMEVYAGYGKNGLKLGEERSEGDLTTPIGAYPILHAFGNAANPGTSMTWRDTTPNSYWSGEEATYNTWVESETPIDGEHLQDYGEAYNYCLAVGFNIDPVVYLRGSAIFFHIKRPERWYTAGCVSLEEASMVKLLQLCHDGVWTIIVPDQESIAQY